MTGDTTIVWATVAVVVVTTVATTVHAHQSVQDRAEWCDSHNGTLDTHSSGIVCERPNSTLRMDAVQHSGFPKNVSDVQNQTDITAVLLEKGN